MAFDGDAALPFNIHIIKYLVLKITFGNGIGYFEQPVGKSAFAVIYMSDDTKISDIFHVK